MFRYEGEITTKVILDFIAEHKKQLARYKQLQDYYENKNTILSRQVMPGNSINNKIANNFAGYITDMATGYFAGRPVNYTQSGKDKNNLLEIIQEIYDYNDEQDENMELSKQGSIKGKCLEVIYLDANDLDENGMPRLRFSKQNAEELFCVYDYSLSAEMYFAVRTYKMKIAGKEIAKIELYTKNMIAFYEKDGSTLKLINAVEHYFGIVPVVEYLNNEEQLGDFEKVLSGIDAYDKAESDSINNLEYFANCYLYLVGFKNTAMKDIDEMREKRVLLLDESGEAGFLTKQENSAETENLANRIKSDIHKFSLVPDMSDEQFANNASGIAMAYKLLGLEQLAVKKERKFKKALQRRLEIIVNYLNFKGGNFNYKDISLSFTRNIPVNDKENVEIVDMLQKIISKKTAISKLKMIDNVDVELDNIKKEKDAYVEDMLSKIDLEEQNKADKGNRTQSVYKAADVGDADES